MTQTAKDLRAYQQAEALDVTDLDYLHFNHSYEEVAEWYKTINNAFDKDERKEVKATKFFAPEFKVIAEDLRTLLPKKGIGYKYIRNNGTKTAIFPWNEKKNKKGENTVMVHWDSLTKIKDYLAVREAEDLEAKEFSVKDIDLSDVRVSLDELKRWRDKVAPCLTANFSVKIKDMKPMILTNREFRTVEKELKRIFPKVVKITPTSLYKKGVYRPFEKIRIGDFEYRAIPVQYVNELIDRLENL